MTTKKGHVQQKRTKQLNAINNITEQGDTRTRKLESCITEATEKLDERRASKCSMYK